MSTTNKDMTFLPKVTDTPGVSFTWQQGAAQGDDSLGINLFFHEIESASAKSSDFEVNIADDEILIIKHKGNKLVQWRLLDTLAQTEDPVEWILNRNTTPISVEINLRKKEDHDWPCLRNQPLIAAEKPEEVLLAQEALEECVGYEVPSLPLEKSAEELAEKKEGEQEEKKKEDEDEEKEIKKAEEEAKDVDIDALLDEVADEMDKDKKKESGADSNKEDDSLEALMKMRREREAQAYVAEFEALEKAEADNKAKLDSEDEAVVKDAKENIELIKKMREIIIEKRHVRTLPVSIENLIRVLKLEVKKIITNSGNEKGEENEEYNNEEEKNMTGEELFKKGLEEVKAQTQSSLLGAFHFLRLASLRHDHPIATMVLHRMYTQFRAPTKGAFFLIRLASLPTTVDKKCNRAVGELIDSGAHPFTAIWSLAVYFLQRAAKEGDAQAMMRLSNLFYDGICHVQRQMIVHPDVKKKFTDKKRGDLLLQAAIDRGLAEAYLLKASFHLRGENGYEKSDELAKKWFALVKVTDQEAAARLGQLFEPKPASPSTEGPGSSFGAGLRGAFNKPADASSSSQQQQRPGAGAMTAAGPGAARPVDRLQALSQRSGGAGEGAGPMTMGMPSRGGMMGGSGGAGGAVSPWQKRFETLARFGAGAYFLYIAAFPVRLVALPYFYELVGGVLSMFGAGGNNRRSMQGGMF